jgi:hypothetical protein
VDEINIPWPTKNDAPFKEGFYSPTQAHLDWFDSFYQDLMIAEAFKEAADKIVDNLETGDNLEHPDKFFFPIAYLYRHAFELGLKGIIQEGIDLNVIATDDNIKEMLNAHNLHKLWNKARYVLEDVWSDADKETLTNAERVILQFHKLDRSGQAFRYAKNISGELHLENAPKLIDLVNLKKVASNLYSFLDACVGGLSNFRDYQHGY